MSSSAEPLLSEPNSSYSRHQHPARKRSPRLTWRCCLIASAVLACVLGSVGAFFVGRFLYTVVHHVVSPHLVLVHQSRPNVTVDDRLVVKPLLNSTSRFDVLTTVWLDVTQHAQEGHTLPEGIPVFTYTQSSGKEMREAVIYCDLMFKNVTMQTGMLHTTTHLRVPVEPFYTQALGPATLRATFRIVPHSTPKRLRLKSASSIYPGYSPIGPRSPASKQLRASGHHQKEEFDRSIDEAMEDSAISVNLVNLLSPLLQIPEANMTLRADAGLDPAMWDGAPSNRAFLNTTTSLITAQDDQKPANIYITRDHQVWVPHLRTRSRLMLLHEDRIFDAVRYTQETLTQLKLLQGACKDYISMSNSSSSSSFISSGDCQRPIRGSVHESFLEFVDETEPESSTESDIYTFYAPYLTHQVSSASSRHHRTIPRYSPLSSEMTKGDENPAKDAHCLVPLLETDSTRTFFEFDWDVSFSTNIHLRGSFAELFEPAKLADSKALNFTDTGKEIRVGLNEIEEAFYGFSSFAFGDREHPKSKPHFFVVHMLLALSTDVVLTLRMYMSLLYWYTRTTSEGLSTKAQSITALTSIVEVFELANTVSKASWISASTMHRVLSTSYSIAIAVLILATLTRIDLTSGWQLIRRRPSKGERNTIRLDATMSWLVPVSVFAAFFTFARYVVPREYNFVGTQACRSAASAVAEEQTRFFTAALCSQVLSALINTGSIVQMIHNYRSKTYAGNFKVYMIFGAAMFALDMAMKRIEWISGWVANREPIELSNFVYFLAAFTFAGQAVIYPGIPQTIGEEGEDAN